ncbi:Translation initiation factor SUI1 [hydrothermal vent metagenome]|uniref:Translation initiation factor SUI1 n=1 Tax=hydrothermal vent metagenome TaxID=652676 RepID=A0A1W1C6G2_9ZZZZ
MHKNLFEMGANFGEEWQSDNRAKGKKSKSIEIKEPNKHRLYFAKEKRMGKVVTIVKPFCLPKDDLSVLLKTIKKRVGTGGTIKGDALEFQGDIADKIHEGLKSLGYRFR